jgi:tRNA pseudouridine55 synthase
MNSVNGIINLNKPPGLSSAAAVSRVKRLLPRGNKIGHAGTLDPFASGVLVLLLGKATRSCEQWMAQPKQYRATFELGVTTPTLDPTSPRIPQIPAAAGPLPRKEIDAVVQRFVGQVMQRPPAFSAMKVNGRRAYSLARQGRPVDLQPRPVRIDGIEVLEYGWPLLKVQIDCGRGTYIRSLAHDIGQALGVGAYVLELCRTAVGGCRIEQAATLQQLQSDGPAAWLVPIE